MLPLLVSLSLPLAVVALGHVGPRTGVSPPTDLCSYLDGPLLVSGINMGHLGSSSLVGLFSGLNTYSLQRSSTMPMSIRLIDYRRVKSCDKKGRFRVP